MKISEDTVDKLLSSLFTINRSITGNGNRKTLSIINKIVPLEILEIPSRSKVFDWSIPNEWNPKEAWIKNSNGEKILDYEVSNLHLLNYSVSFKGRLKLKNLIKHLFFLKEQPNAIPYKTSYYNKNWGFCLSYNHFKKYFNEEETYEIFIDSELSEGSLTIADYKIENKQNTRSYFFSTYFCHPSLANDNLSGLVLTSLLAKKLTDQKRLKNNYRFIFVPETIGSISYCALFSDEMKSMDGGFIMT